MFSVVCIVGRSNSGKTTLLEQLIIELKSRGHHIAAIKHSACDIDIDHPGKDSWRFAQGGSQVVIVSSPHRFALMKHTDFDTGLDELLSLVDSDVDLVLVEGFKKATAPKIEVHRKDLGGMVCSPDELLAVVTDDNLDVAVPQYSPLDIVGLADLIEREGHTFPSGECVSLRVNGKLTPIDPSVKSVISKVLLAMASDDIEQVHSLHFSLRKETD